MAAHVTNSRKGLRRLERATGEKLVWATGPWVTTVDHRHLAWNGNSWHPIPDQEAAACVPGYSPCGLPTGFSSCRWLFGEPEHGFTRGLMRGPCGQCGVGCSELHRWDCGRLNSLMTHVNPDYWPRPVHRPMWLDDPRRDRVHMRTRSMYQLALALDVPIELMGIHGNHWSSWVTTGQRSACWRCGQPPTHVVEWPPGRVEGTHGLPVRSFACRGCAERIQQYQASCGTRVTVRRVE